MQKITLKLNIDNTATIGDVANAVRRALTVESLKGLHVVADVPVVSKGVTLSARAIKAPTQAHNPVREWAKDNGYPQVAGKRGRLPKEAIAAYEDAHK